MQAGGEILMTHTVQSNPSGRHLAWAASRNWVHRADPSSNQFQAWSLCFLLRFFLIFYAYGQWCRPLGDSRLTLCFKLDLQCGCVIQEKPGSTEPVDILSSFYARRAVSLLLQLAWCGIPQILRTYPALRAPLLQLLMSRRSEWSYACSNCRYDSLLFGFFENCFVQNGQRFEQRPVHVRGGPSEFPTGFAAFPHFSGVSYVVDYSFYEIFFLNINHLC